jgi:hypothetical protein
MIHFGRRGRENLASLTRKDFAVKQDSDGALYVYKTTDEQTKNHQMDHQKSSDRRCGVFNLCQHFEISYSRYANKHFITGVYITINDSYR